VISPWNSDPQVVRGLLLINIEKTLSCGYYVASLLICLGTSHATDRTHSRFPCRALLIGVQRIGRFCSGYSVASTTQALVPQEKRKRLISSASRTDGGTGQTDVHSRTLTYVVWRAKTASRRPFGQVKSHHPTLPSTEALWACLQCRFRSLHNHARFFCIFWVSYAVLWAAISPDF
jgi:hypothetical protein